MVDATNRTGREQEDRAATQRVRRWEQPQGLPTPEPEAGYSFRWIRTALLGQFDPTNTSAKFREGWEPVKAESQPGMHHFADPNSRFKGNIEIGGLLLCKIPEEFMQQRAAHYNKASNDQIRAVDNNFMQQNDSRMPLFSEKKSTVSFGSGNK
tara:strand:- start:3503 stop:3961 length:459 start_codon:yes stop_codon:yes gene_type:complete